jgi:hypothetical protein
MSAWLSLFKKEFRNGLPALLFSLISLAVLLVLALFFGWRGGHVKDMILITSLVLIFPHVFYLTFYMIVSLQREKKKLHLWLHSPMPGYQLLLAKFLNGLVAMSITLFLTGMICLITFATYNNYPFWDGKLPIDIMPFIYKVGAFATLHIYLFAIDFAIWFMFFWVFYRMLIRRLGVAISVILTIILFVLVSYLLTKFESTALYDMLTQWGRISLTPLFPTFDYLTAGGIRNITSHAYIYFGTYFFEAVIAIILFLVSSWILDRKVEV